VFLTIKLRHLTLKYINLTNSYIDLTFVHINLTFSYIDLTFVHINLTNQFITENMGDSLLWLFNHNKILLLSNKSIFSYLFNYNISSVSFVPFL
jgi:hypothetical protein